MNDNSKEDAKEEDEADRPVPTLKGGYSHTKKSRENIGLANKGNAPWNKGKARSEEEKVSFKSSSHFCAVQLFMIILFCSECQG